MTLGIYPTDGEKNNCLHKLIKTISTVIVASNEIGEVVGNCLCIEGGRSRTKRSANGPPIGKQVENVHKDA